MRFAELLTDIRNNNRKWIKATEHSRLYDARHLNHDDMPQGWNWWNEVENEYERGNILIYKDKSDENWFVLPVYGDEFENEYRNMRRK